VIGRWQAIIALGYKFFLLLESAGGAKMWSRWGKDVTQTCGSFFLSHFGERSLSSKIDAIAILSFVVSKKKF